MEEVLEVYTRPYDPDRPLVCMNEINTQLLADTRDPLPMESGKTQCEDYEYERHGVCNVFLACEPLVGTHVTMTAPQRTKREWAEFVRRLAEEHYPTADKIVLVLDNLNTHTLAALYEIFPIAQARRLCQCFEVHYTPSFCGVRSSPVGTPFFYQWFPRLGFSPSARRDASLPRSPSALPSRTPSRARWVVPFALRCPHWRLSKR